MSWDITMQKEACNPDPVLHKTLTRAPSSFLQRVTGLCVILVRSLGPPVQRHESHWAVPVCPLQLGTFSSSQEESWTPGPAATCLLPGLLWDDDGGVTFLFVSLQPGTPDESRASSTGSSGLCPRCGSAFCRGGSGAKAARADGPDGHDCCRGGRGLGRGTHHRPRHHWRIQWRGQLRSCQA